MNAPKRTTQMSLTIAALLFLSQPARAIENENLTYDAETGIYTIQYYNTYDQPVPVLQRAQFELPTRIDPTIKSKVKEPDKGVIVYQYKVINGKLGKQNLKGMRLLATHAYETSQSTPNGWRGSIILKGAINMFNVGWSYWVDNTGLKVGKSQNGFGFQSRDLPGIGDVETWGRVRRDLKGFPDMGPSSNTPVGKQYLELVNNNETVPRPAAVPRIAVPTPFSAATVLSGIQKHMNEDLVKMKLIDPGFAASLDRLFHTAVAAAQQGNTTALRSHLKEIRQALKKEHMDLDKEDDDSDDREDEKKGKKEDKRLIDKLAAKVLDFDLKYVLKRTGEKD